MAEAQRKQAERRAVTERETEEERKQTEAQRKRAQRTALEEGEIEEERERRHKASATATHYRYNSSNFSAQLYLQLSHWTMGRLSSYTIVTAWPVAHAAPDSSV